jgi:signal recognition particle receptor subunit beta
MKTKTLPELLIPPSWRDFFLISFLLKSKRPKPMTPQTHHFYQHNVLYNNISKAIKEQQCNTGQKPVLVQINRQDYRELTSTSSGEDALGLSIDSVTVISFVDIGKGSFFFIS